SQPRRNSARASRASSVDAERDCATALVVAKDSARPTATYRVTALRGRRTPLGRSAASWARRAAFSASIASWRAASTAGLDTGATWPTASEYLRDVSIEATTTRRSGE